MSILMTVLMVVQVLSALGVIVLVLLQHGKGADMGAAFGSGASGSLFGASGSANFMSRTTGGLATVFFCATLGIAMMSDRRVATPTSVMEGVGAAAKIPLTAPGSVPTPAPGSSTAQPAAGQAPGALPAAGESPASGGPGAIPGSAPVPSQR